LSKWDVSGVYNFYQMFNNCYVFNSDLSKWDVSNGEKFDYMFYECKNFNADLSRWDVSSARSWDEFAKKSLLERYPERIPSKFRRNYL
jgi:surface protein